MSSDEKITPSSAPGFSMKSVTCTAPVNIAVIKYWGKRDEKLVLPVNSSLSATLGQDELCATTTVAASRDFTDDRMWLNGKEESLNTPRMQNVFREIRRRARKRKAGDDEREARISELINWHIHVCSENNFPTAAGLASSAAGFSCLVYSLAKLFDVEGDLSEIARQGSGSACRSMLGGFVAWNMGEQEDGTDSTAEQIAPEDHWPEMRIIILVVSDQKKHIGSSVGMQVSVKTSELLKYRAETAVPSRMQRMKKAILEKDFQTFAKLTMQDSNQFHAVCLDTYPPVIYLNDTSKQIIHLVHKYNEIQDQIKVAYTFDAGPNACLYLLEKDVSEVLQLFQNFLPSSDHQEIRERYTKGLKTHFSNQSQVSNQVQDLIDQTTHMQGTVKYIISTKVGPGPRVLTDESASLLDKEGLPRTLT